MVATIRTAAAADAEIAAYFAEKAETDEMTAILASRFVTYGDALKASDALARFFAGTSTIVTIWAQAIPTDERTAALDWMPDALRVVPVADVDTLRGLVAEAAKQPWDRKDSLLDTYAVDGAELPAEFRLSDPDWLDDGLGYDTNDFDTSYFDAFDAPDYPDYPA